MSHKIIKPKGFLTDATVFESDITYPTDCGLLNKAREFCVNQIGHLRNIVGEKVRTYRRRAQKEYMKFTKKRQKTKADVRKMQKSLLQYLRRNMERLRGLIEHLEDQGFVLSNRLKETFRTVRAIYAQQKKMYMEKVNSIPSRIVSLHKPYVRPIIRNKSGKRTEFGSKFSLSQVDGYLFVDHHDYENYNEGGYLEISVEKFQKRFGRQPSYVAMDQIYGSRENRSFLKNEEIRSSVRPLGRRSQQPSAANENRWRKQKNKERNRIEGSFGVAKEKYLLRKVRARTQQTEISWIQMGILSHNLVTAARRI